MDNVLIFVCAFIGWFGVDAILNRRILFSILAIPLKSIPAIAVGLIALVMSIKLLSTKFGLLLDPSTQVTSIVSFIAGLVSSILVNRWMYDPKTLEHDPNRKLFKSLKGIFLALLIIFIILAILLIPFGSDKRNLVSILFP